MTDPQYHVILKCLDYCAERSMYYAEKTDTVAVVEMMNHITVEAIADAKAALENWRVHPLNRPQ